MSLDEQQKMELPYESINFDHSILHVHSWRWLAIVLFHIDIPPSGELPQQRILAHNF